MEKRQAAAAAKLVKAPWDRPPRAGEGNKKGCFWV